MPDPDWGAGDAAVLESLRGHLEAGRDAVVATVVSVEGSAYRRPGAKMLLEGDGTARGHITAGCLEDELAALVADVLAADEPRLETYDLTTDDDVWGLGVGCNGIVEVLVEPLDESYEPLAEAVGAGDPVGVVTVLEGASADGTEIPLGARAYYRNGDAEPADDRVPDRLVDAVRDRAATLVDRDGAETVTLETEAGEATVFVDGIRPAPKLTVLGSGHDVGPVVELGAKNGFRVEVVSFRGAVDLEERFPDADRRVSTSPADLANAVALDENTYAVAMTHNFVDDRLALEALLDADVPYVGLMGPRERFEELLAEFEDEGRSFDEGELDSVYTPVGLDLGSGSPYGIATSIVAEALAVHNDREPSHLADRSGPIHDRVDLDSSGGE